MLAELLGYKGWWMLIAPPVIWSVHFLLCYISAAVFCAKLSGEASLWPVRVTIAVYTAVALAAILALGWRSQRWWRGGQAALDADTPESRRRFIGFTALLLSALSAVAVTYSALPAVFIENCW